MRNFKVDVRWHAHAVITVRAENKEQAEEKARDKGLPWRHAEEADDGDGYECNVLEDGKEARV